MKKKEDKLEVKDKNKSKKVIMIITIIIVVILVLITAILSYLYVYNNNAKIKYDENINIITKQNQAALKEYKEEVKANTIWTYEDAINNLIDESKLSKDTTIKITINDKLFNKEDTYTFTVGENKINIYLNKTYTYKIFKEETKVIENKKEIIIQVEDKDIPILDGVKDKTITVGDELSILEGITAKDEVDGDLEVKFEGEVDTSKAGTYKVKIYAEDKSGNRVEQEMTITVKKKTTTTKPSTGSTTKPSTSSGNDTSSTCKYTATLKKRGYKSTDPDACEKDRQASEIARQIASEINSKGYGTDLEKVQAAASKVSEYYYKGTHIESGNDYRTPYGVFIKGEASCAGCTRALILVLEYMGFTNLVHANENGWTHQWVILTMDGQKGYADGQVGMVGYGCHMMDNSCS